VTVRVLGEDGRQLGQVDVSLQAGDWQTVSKLLRVEQPISIPGGTPLTVELLSHRPGTVWLDRCSLRPANAKGGWDPDVVALMKAASLPLLRFPGGNFASGYHWRDGVGPPDNRPIRPNPAWPEIEWNEVGTDEWLALCRIVGCDALICVNAGDGTPEEAAQWVEYCNGSVDTPMGALRAANGHEEPYGVKLWEIGNELYGHWQIGHTTPAGYAERYLRFREAMLAVDPSIQLIANGDDADWNRTLVKSTGDTVRSLSVHTLVGSHIPREADQKEVFEEYMGYSWAYADLLTELTAPMKDAGLTPRLAITELSIFTHKPHLPHVDNLSEALYYSGIVNTALRSRGLVEVITHSALINHSGGLVKDRGVVYPHPLWLALHLYSTQPGVQPVVVEVEGPAFDSSGRWLKKVEGVPTLDAVALLSADRERLTVFVTNQHAAETLDVDLGVDGFPARSSVEVCELTGDSFLSANRWDATDAVKISTRRMRVSEGRVRWRSPACSFARLMFHRRKLY
jgi:alpha-N-arabinofuranosidase